MIPTSTESALVRYHAAGGIARITLADGEHGNPIHLESVRQLQAAVTRARDDQARVLVLDAEGRHFSVGGDLKAFGSIDSLPHYIDELVDALHRVITELVRSDAIVVSVVQGSAAGAGFSLAATADVVVASRRASFTLGYTRVGLSVDGGTSLIAHTLGLHRMLRLALLNDTLSAEDAHTAGLVARVCAAEELGGVADRLAAALAAGSGGAQAAAKRLVRAAVDDAPERALSAEARSIRQRAGTADGREGIRAFLEKRPPSFDHA